MRKVLMIIAVAAAAALLVGIMLVRKHRRLS